jgi:hypothetical protein
MDDSAKGIFYTKPIKGMGPLQGLADRFSRMSHHAVDVFPDDIDGIPDGFCLAGGRFEITLLSGSVKGMKSRDYDRYHIKACSISAIRSSRSSIPTDNLSRVSRTSISILMDSGYSA